LNLTISTVRVVVVPLKITAGHTAGRFPRCLSNLACDKISIRAMMFSSMVDRYVRHGRMLDNALEYNEYGSGDTTAVSAVYISIACVIFVLLAAQLLFPSNRFLPIDRRTSSISCAVLGKRCDVYCFLGTSEVLTKCISVS